MRPRALLLWLLLAAFAATPATASATTFGANLSREPNSPTTCLGAQIIIVATTCSASSIDLSTGESNFPPAGEGVVSRVRVRVGPATGPMQIVEEEALRQDNPADPGHPTYACCKAVATSGVFTPAANAITTVPVDFHVKQDLAPEPSGYYVDQHLSLSVLDPNVPIPANIDPNASDGLWFPAWQPGEERAGIFGTAGAMVLFNADWEPAGEAGGGGGATGGGAGGGGPAGAAKAPLTLANPTVPVRGGHALLELLCNQAVPCIGRAQLQNQQTVPAAMIAFARAKPRPVTYASATFKIPAGKKGTIKAPLERAGRRLLAHRRKAAAWLNVSLKGSAASVPSARITLRK
jgi:hypothetical protein